MNGKTLKEEASKATTILQNSKAQLLGASLNGSQVRTKVYEFQQ
jgi:protein-tyrosine kinase